MDFNIEKGDQKRIVIVGGGFGGLELAKNLRKTGMQIVLIDKHNYHQFQPLIYQVRQQEWSQVPSHSHTVASLKIQKPLLSLSRSKADRR